MKQLSVFLINPYIYDYSAYSFWSSPLGLLYVGAILRKNNMDIRLIDCMRTVEEKRKADGRGPFIKEKVGHLLPLRGIHKRLKRYGISKEQLAAELSILEPPDLILVTSIMTYWYPGTQEVVEIARELFPSSKIIVGGIYPTLCYDQAIIRMSKADLVVRHNEIERLYAFIENRFSLALSFKPSPYDLHDIPYPAYDLYNDIPFVPLLTSYGCAFACTYCATPYMHPRIVRRDAGHVVDEICYWHEYGVKRYIIYDDSLLYKSALFAKPLLKKVSTLPFPIEIYNPNAINAAFIDEELACLLFSAGFQEVRIGLETIDAGLQVSTGGKVNLKVFERALGHLSKGGFSMDQISAYILSGLPFQKWQDVKASIDYLSGLGVRTHIAEYTPIPHTPLFDTYHMHARYPISEDAIYQNNALFPFAWEGFTDEDLAFLKQYVQDKSSR
ncbi:MAG: B12-binding domain-containing radical SAM protein [Syntrophus sp. (in: bacteria)]|nr:B12-binding domain-containing radical SAM protein [Syntrophus sp. (in: bacteria)]